MLDNKLIESALWLTGKTMDLVLETKTIDHWSYWHEPYEVISIGKFCYYLISEDFIKSYKESPGNYGMNIEIDFLYAIQDYQSWNEEPLIKLLTPLCKTTNND